MIYEWKNGTRGMKGVDAQSVGERLEKIREKFGGFMTPEMVVDDARKPRSPLHDVFEWDDIQAAGRYRAEQAGYVIRHISVTISVGAEETVTRAFVSIQQDDGARYTSIIHAMSDAELRKQVLQQAWSELEAWKGKYKEYDELSHIFAAMTLPEQIAV